jgi:serine protease Do
MAAAVAEAIKTISKEQSPSIVRIRSHDGHGEIVGTGFYIDPSGTVVTLAEIVRSALDISIEQGSNAQSISLLAIDERSGIAFLKSTNSAGSESFLSPAPNALPPPFTPVVSIGYPREQQCVTSLGMITGSRNHEGENYFCVNHLIGSIPLTEGEGGSPVLDLTGKLLGIVITGNTQLGQCTILPVAAIEHLHRNLLRYGALKRGWVGAVVEVAAVPVQNSRTRVVSIAPGSPAEASGIRPGDMLLQLGTNTIETPEDVLEASYYLTAGETIPITLAREGTIEHLTLRCTEHPNAEKEPQSGMEDDVFPLSAEPNR